MSNPNRRRVLVTEAFLDACLRGLDDARRRDARDYAIGMSDLRASRVKQAQEGRGDDVDEG